MSLSSFVLCQAQNTQYDIRIREFQQLINVMVSLSNHEDGF